MWKRLLIVILMCVIFLAVFYFGRSCVIVYDTGDNMQRVNEMLDNLNENAVNFNDSLSSIDNQIKYMDLLEEIKKDIKANENDIINALISTNGNKAEAKKLLI